MVPMLMVVSNGCHNGCQWLPKLKVTLKLIMCKFDQDFLEINPSE